ncbi:hypothetical protein [Streptomyces scabiei]|uniref:hypothetical protein n=1 Tax=Streptomyces scabiei TaxID=1930 RepID=UPI0029BFBAEB|nr:hypothetical protein [Streptomyces scabiei]
MPYPLVSLRYRAPARDGSPWSYTVAGIPRRTGRSAMSGSTRDRLPPASPQPIRACGPTPPAPGAEPAHRVRHPGVRAGPDERGGDESEVVVRPGAVPGAVGASGSGR